MPEVTDEIPRAKRPAVARIATSASAKLIPVPRALLLWLTIGVAGALLFTATYLIEGATRPGYSAWQQPISALSRGPGGWVQQANFVIFGICTLCQAVAWGRVLKGGVGAISYPIIRAIEGVAEILVGFFSQDPAPGYPPGAHLTPLTLHGEIHIVGAFVIIGALTLGFCVMAWRFASELHWTGWAACSVISAVLTLFFMSLFGMAMRSGYAGLFERLATSSETVWGVLLLAHLWAGAKFMRPVA